MKRIFFFFIINFFLFSPLFSQIKIIYPYTQNPDFTAGYEKVWKVPEIVIKGGTEINNGVKIIVNFSTGSNYIDDNVISIGSSVNHSLEAAFSFYLKSGVPSLLRNVKFKDQVRIFPYSWWAGNPLNKKTDYTLRIEFDENKFRYSIWETETPNDIKYEYDFYGLYDSNIKNILSKPSSTFSVGINPNYKIDKIIVEELGHNVGVEPLPIPRNITLGKFKNTNSNRYLSIYRNSVAEGEYIVQNSYPWSSIWQFTPQYQPNRVPSAFNGELKSIFSGGNLVIQNCTLHDGSYLVNTHLESTCSNWQINRNKIRDNSFRLLNVKNKKYAVTKDESKAQDAYIVEWGDMSKPGGIWALERESYPHLLKEGYYEIQNKVSNLYIESYHASYGNENPLVQYSQSNTLRNLWYVKPEKNGLYTIMNVDTQKNFAVYSASPLSEGENIVQEDIADRGNQKWVIEPDLSTDYYSIRNIDSEMYAVVKNSSKSEGENIIQSSKKGDYMYWKFVPVSYRLPERLGEDTGGIFYIQGTYNGLSLGVEGASTSEKAPIVSMTIENTPDTWWKIMPVGNSGYVLKNINSQLYAVVNNASMEKNANLIQYTRDGDNKHGNSVWILVPDTSVPGKNFYWIKNGHSGKYIHFVSDEYKKNTPVVQTDEKTPQIRFRIVKVTP